MYLLSEFYRLQRLQAEEGRRDLSGKSSVEREIRKRLIQRELSYQRRKVATWGTVICILILGSILLVLGICLICTGIYIPRFQENNKPWLVTGPTVVLAGVLVLLLPVETIIKRRRVKNTGLTEDKKKMTRNLKIQSWMAKRSHKIVPVAQSTNKYNASKINMQHVSNEQRTILSELSTHPQQQNHIYSVPTITLNNQEQLNRNRVQFSNNPLTQDRLASSAIILDPKKLKSDSYDSTKSQDLQSVSQVSNLQIPLIVVEHEETFQKSTSHKDSSNRLSETITRPRTEDYLSKCECPIDKATVISQSSKLHSETQNKVTKLSYDSLVPPTVVVDLKTLERRPVTTTDVYNSNCVDMTPSSVIFDTKITEVDTKTTNDLSKPKCDNFEPFMFVLDPKIKKKGLKDKDSLFNTSFDFIGPSVITVKSKIPDRYPEIYKVSVTSCTYPEV